MEVNEIYKGDCLELMKDIPTNSVDMILCDLPFGQTARNKWDSVIPFEPLWQQYGSSITELLKITVQSYYSQTECSRLT